MQMSSLISVCRPLPWPLFINDNNNKHKAAAHAEKGPWRAWLAVACSVFDGDAGDRLSHTLGHKEKVARGKREREVGLLSI